MLEALTKEYEMAKGQEVEKGPANRQDLRFPSDSRQKVVPAAVANHFCGDCVGSCGSDSLAILKDSLGPNGQTRRSKGFLRKRFLAICGGACLDLRGTVPARVEQGKSRWLSIKTESATLSRSKIVVCDCLQLG